MGDARAVLERISKSQNFDGYRQEHWHGSFDEYLDIVRKNPRVTRTAYQRLYDMILSYGTTPVEGSKDGWIRYRFFDDPDNGGADAIFGLTRPLMEIVNVFRSAALKYGSERRVSAVARSGRQLQEHDRPAAQARTGTLQPRRKTARSSPTAGRTTTDRFSGARCTRSRSTWCPRKPRAELVRFLNEKHDLSNGEHYGIEIVGELCPLCRFTFSERLERAGGDWTKAVEQIVVKRLTLSEPDRIGIGTFQPKDEKNQDSTELTGDINYRKIAEFGSESDPRAFNFDGEFNVANRGVIEFIEVLKLDVAFLYDLLGASQEHKIKPKKFAQTDIDTVIVGHTNEPEYRKLQSNEFMEALRDRTVKIDIPYVTKLADEQKIYEKDYNSKRVRGKHIAPHTLEMAAMWAVLTRLEDPKNAGLTLLQKLKLYNGKTLPGFTSDNVAQLRKEAKSEGHARHFAALRAGQDLQRPGRECRLDQPQSVHGDERARRGTQAPLADSQRRNPRALSATDRRRQRRVHRHREERSAAGDRRRRRGPHAALLQLHRQREGLHAAGKGPQQVHRPAGGTG